MRPSARVQMAIDLLDGMFEGLRPADQVLATIFRRSRFIGSKDRRAVRDLVYGVIRHRSRLVHRLRQYGADETPRALVLAYLVISGTESISELFDGSAHSPMPLDGREPDMVTELAHFHGDADQPVPVRLEIPDWLYPLLQQSFGDNLIAEMQGLNAEAPVDLRANSLKSDRDTELAALRAADIEAEATAYSPIGIRLSRRLTLGNYPSYKEGRVEVQDEGSQLAALLCGVKPKMKVIDFCAGAGGKTLALAAAMKGRGDLIACDTDGRRLAELQVRADAAGITEMLGYRALSGDDDPWLTEHAGKADVVLVDAPCSGVGAWRRSPDARWLLTEERLQGYLDLQKEILDRAATLVKPGGKLVYVTCSLLRDENEAQSAAFRDRQPGFASHDLGPELGELGLSALPSRQGEVTLSPATTGTDGFFISVMRRADG